MSAYEAVIGLEVHAQLKTQAKMFSDAPVGFGAAPNSLVHEVCAGHPGSLPTVNGQAVRLAIRAGLALSCALQRVSVFSRKHYFYPDLPKGYQISQYDMPICWGGVVAYELDGEPRACDLTRIHLEEDSGKSAHTGEESTSHIDLNRAGTPLIEIVSEPSLRSPEEAAAYFKALHQLLVCVGVTEGVLAEGHMRCDANVSVRPVGQEAFGTKVEIKNLNSFKFLKDALAFEIRRQTACAQAGEVIEQETRLWDDTTKQTFVLRKKEGAADYRYFPEPDLPPLVLDDAWIEAERAALPELPHETRARLQSAYALSPYDAAVLTANEGFVPRLDHAVAMGANPKAIVNWLTGPIAGAANAGEVALCGDAALSFEGAQGARVPLGALVDLQQLVDQGRLSHNLARQVWAKMLETGDGAAQVMEREGLEQVADTGALARLVDEVIAANPNQVAAYRKGKTALMGFFLGQVMKASQGKADPKQLQPLLEAALSAEPH